VSSRILLQQSVRPALPWLRSPCWASVGSPRDWRATSWDDVALFWTEFCIPPTVPGDSERAPGVVLPVVGGSTRELAVELGEAGWSGAFAVPHGAAWAVETAQMSATPNPASVERPSMGASSCFG
jgi:hypothetical protein